MTGYSVGEQVRTVPLLRAAESGHEGAVKRRLSYDRTASTISEFRVIPHLT